MVTAELLARSPLLRHLPEESLTRLASVARRRTYRRGEIIFHQGDPGDTLRAIPAIRSIWFNPGASRSSCPASRARRR